MSRIGNSKAAMVHRKPSMCQLFAGATMVLVLTLSQLHARADELLVSAAASLSDVMAEIGEKYQSTSEDRILFNFGPSSGLARQIAEGAPVDVFFSANLVQMDRLEKNARLERGSRRNLLSNQLVMIVPFDSRLAPSSPRDLAQAGVKTIALAEPSSVPAGVYSKSYLMRAGLWNRLESKVVPVKDVRATLASVAAANADAGFVYKTDAAMSDRVKIVYEVPVHKGPDITYPIAIINQSKQKPAASDFIRYLESPAAKDIFAKYGFVVLD